MLKLKQRFALLIRSLNDTGTVLILHPRVRAKPYGRMLLATLPQSGLTVENVEPR